MAASVQHCPNCGAPLDLEERDDCAWCSARVVEDEVDPFHEDEAEALLARVGLGEYDSSLPQPVPTIVAVLRYAAYDEAARRFLQNQIPFARELAGATLAAGKRAQLAGATNADAFGRGDEVFTREEWATFDLATDFLAVLASVSGIEHAVAAELRAKVKFIDEKLFDKPWAKGLRPTSSPIGRRASSGRAR